MELPERHSASSSKPPPKPRLPRGPVAAARAPPPSRPVAAARAPPPPRSTVAAHLRPPIDENEEPPRVPGNGVQPGRLGQPPRPPPRQVLWPPSRPSPRREAAAVEGAWMAGSFEETAGWLEPPAIGSSRGGQAVNVAPPPPVPKEKTPVRKGGGKSARTPTPSPGTSPTPSPTRAPSPLSLRLDLNSAFDESMGDAFDMFGEMPARCTSPLEVLEEDDVECHDDAEMSEIDTTTAGMAKSARKGNYSTKEDKALVIAWLNVSTDPIVGTDQNNSIYWNRISHYFHANVEGGSNRTTGSLSHRWKHIQKSCNLWAGCVSQVEQAPRSVSTMS